MALVPCDLTAGNEDRSVGCGFAESAEVEATVAEQSRQLPPSVLAIETKTVAQAVLPGAPAACMGKEGTHEQRVVLRIRKGCVFGVAVVGLKEVKQPAGFTGDERRRVTGAVREHRAVGSTASSRSGHLQAGSRRGGMSQADGNVSLTGQDDGARVEGATSGVMKVRLDRPIDAGPNRPIVCGSVRVGDVPYPCPEPRSHRGRLSAWRRR